MENLTVLTIAELLRRGRGLTGASSFSTPSIPPKPNQTSSIPSIPPNPTPSSSSSNPNPNSTPNILPSLNHSALIIGTVTLPTAAAAAAAPRCPFNACFQFSDDSAASICCDVLDFDARILHHEINVLAWNFIPSKRCGGGFLEIIRWAFRDSVSAIRPCSNVISIDLGSSDGNEDSSKARYGVFGAVESVSPLSIVSCRTGDSDSKSNAAFDSAPPTSLRGFLVLFMVCGCRACSSKESIVVLKDSIRESGSHSFRRPVFVYCCGSASSWHPVFTKLVGNVVAVSGLKKKLVFIGKEESKVMCVTTGSSVLHLNTMSKKCLPNVKVVRKGNGEVGTYRGVVRGVYMQGMLVELDNEVWLLLTDQLLSPPHSLRAGALVSVRNVHFVNPRLSWARRMLILGACFRTNVIVESFSPLETRCHIASQSQSSLGKFIESLAFSSRLWVLLVASYFRKKFAGILSEKEILGSKHKGGLVEMFASSQMPSSKHHTRPGVFMEFCKYDICACSCEPYMDILTLAIPLSLFICHCELTWSRALNPEGNSQNLHDDKQNSRQFCDGRSYVQSIRKIFSSEDIGITLVGFLKTSPYSGRLQLVDATGSIDVLVPDLPSAWDSTKIIKVVEYCVIIEGMPGSVDSDRLLEYDLRSTRTIFDFVPLARKANLTVCAYFRLRSSLCRNVCFYPCTGLGEDLQRFESGTYHLLLITHKFPLLNKFQGDMLIKSSLSMFVEAIILPWNLSVAGNKAISCQSGEIGCGPKTAMEFGVVDCYWKNNSFKRRKISDSSRKEASSGSMGSPCEAIRKLDSFSKSCIESSDTKTYSSLSSHEISCVAIISGVARSVILHGTEAKLKRGGFSSPSGQKILLEFKPDSFHKYQLLQIGYYYITKHDREDLFCNLKNSGNFIGKRILIPSTTHLWSLSFGKDEGCQNDNSSKCVPLDDSLRSEEVLSGYHNEVLLQMSSENLSGTSSDMSLCLSASVLGLGELHLKELKDSLIKPVGTPKDIPKISPCVDPVMTAPLLSIEPNFMFPQGNLISVSGHVVAVHSIEDTSVEPHWNCQNRSDLEMRFLQRATSCCIHLLVDHQIVKLSGSLHSSDLPVGFGPGVVATFNRIIALREQNRWILTSVSFITIHSISGVNESCAVKFSNPALYMPNASPQEIIRSGLISELVQCLDSKPMMLHCRVVAIHFLVLEKKSRHVNHQLNHLGQHLVDIPLAGFVLDDGSSPCCCWASAERAATLLRLYEEFPQSAFESSGWTLKWGRTNNNAWTSTIHHLERILNNHHRIVVRNYGSTFDSSYQDLAVSVSSDNILNSYDENLLKFVVFNACFSRFWTIGATVMESDAFRRLNTENLMEPEMSMHSMQHIWATEVQHINHLSQARNVIQDLIDG